MTTTEIHSPDVAGLNAHVHADDPEEIKLNPKYMYEQACMRGLKRVKSKRAGTAAAERYDARWNDQDVIEAEHVPLVYPNDAVSRADLKWEIDRQYVIFGDEEYVQPEAPAEPETKKQRRARAPKAEVPVEYLEDPSEVYDFDVLAIEDLN